MLARSIIILIVLLGSALLSVAQDEERGSSPREDGRGNGKRSGEGHGRGSGRGKGKEARGRGKGRGDRKGKEPRGKDGDWMCVCDSNTTNGTDSWPVSEKDEKEDVHHGNFTDEQEDVQYGNFTDEWEAPKTCMCGSVSGYWMFVGLHDEEHDKDEHPFKGKGGRKGKGQAKDNGQAKDTEDMGLLVKVAIFAGGSLVGGMLSTLLILACCRWRARASHSSQKAVQGAVVVGMPALGTADLENGTSKSNAV